MFHLSSLVQFIQAPFQICQAFGPNLTRNPLGTKFAYHLPTKLSLSQTKFCVTSPNHLIPYGSLFITSPPSWQSSNHWTIDNIPKEDTKIHLWPPYPSTDIISHLIFKLLNTLPRTTPTITNPIPYRDPVKSHPIKTPKTLNLFPTLPSHLRHLCHHLHPPCSRYKTSLNSHINGYGKTTKKGR